MNEKTDIIQFVRQFAERYRIETERVSAARGEALRHPSVFVLLGDEGDTYEDLLRFSSESAADGVFFLLIPTESMEAGSVGAVHAIRALKADIQRNEARLNVKRVNISVLIQATMVQEGISEKAGLLLRSLFSEDFPIVYISLFILLSESNIQENFEKRSAASLRLLYEVQRFQNENYVGQMELQLESGGGIIPIAHNGALYQLAWLLSDRNEYDTVSDENRQNNLAAISSLHFLTHTDSRFEDTVHKKEQGTALFVTAGMAKLTKPNREIAFTVFRRVMEHIAGQIGDSTGKTETARTYIQTYLEALPEHPSVQAAMSEPISEEKMSHGMMSVTANSVNGRALHKKTLYEVEQLLYDDRAKRFFEVNYASYGETAALALEALNVSKVLADIKEHINSSGLAAAKWYRQGGEALLSFEKRITQCELELEMRYQTRYTNKPFQGTENAKRMIADLYTLRTKAEWLRRLRDIMRKIDDALLEFCEQCKEYLALMSQTTDLLIKHDTPGLHISEYYGQVVDQIMLELTARYGEGFYYREEFIGSIFAAWESGNFFERVVGFIEQYIFPHPSMRLTFDEDLQERATVAPDFYDSKFTDKNEFYRQLLAEADKKAALAISLQRYDDLIFEKYYFGDINGACMQFAQENSRSGETAYFLEDASGFKLIRLAGGFTPEDLTRYRAMKTHLEALKSRV